LQGLVLCTPLCLHGLAPSIALGQLRLEEDMALQREERECVCVCVCASACAWTGVRGEMGWMGRASGCARWGGRKKRTVSQ